jgi:hypothetical protein
MISPNACPTNNWAGESSDTLWNGLQFKHPNREKVQNKLKNDA